MKKQLFTFFAFLTLGFAAQAQSPIMISEFSYNPPEGGTDSLEYVEIYNNSTNPVDISGYQFYYGATLSSTVPTNTTLAANSTFVFAVNSSAVQRQYNMTTTPLQWTGSGLGNSNGILVIKDVSGTTIDSVRYVANDLPSATNAGGASAVLCDKNADNNVMSNWTASTNAILNPDNTPRVINTKSLFGSPNFIECGANVSPSGPANDECAAAISLTPGVTCVYTTGSYEDATESMTPCEGTAAADVWYSFVATSTNMQINVNTVSSDIVIEVFSGACGSLVSMDCVDGMYYGVESFGGSVFTVGNTYYVRVHEYDGLATGTEDFEICVTEVVASPNAPANDECAGAISLTAGATCTSTIGSYEEASQSLSPCTGTAAADVWYSFVATATNMQVEVTTTTDDIVFEVFSGVCGSLSTVGCIDGVVTGTESASGNIFTIGETYYIRVYEYDGLSTGTEDFEICVLETYIAPPPANDECADAVVLTHSTSCNWIAGTTEGATETMPEGDCTTYDGIANDVWYSFVATDVDAVISVQGVDGFDAIIEAYSGSCTTLNSLGCGDENYPSSSELNVTDSLVLSNLTIGETYYVRVYEYDAAASGYYDFNICIKALASAANPCDTTNLVITLDGCDASHEVTAVTGGVAPYTYAWSTGDATQAITGLVLNNSYSVTVTDVNGCTNSVSFTQQTCPGVGEVASGFNMNVYPNPAKSAAVLSLQTTNATDLSIELVNVMGQVISSQIVVNNGTMTYALPIENLSAGVYFVKVSSKEGVATKQLIIAK